LKPSPNCWGLISPNSATGSVSFSMTDWRPSAPLPMANLALPTTDLGKGWQAEGPIPLPTPMTMKSVDLTPEQRRPIERRRKETLARRVSQRLTAVLTVAEGESREEVAHLLGIGLSQLGEWLRLYRNKGLDGLCALHYQGDPGKLTAAQVLA